MLKERFEDLKAVSIGSVHDEDEAVSLIAGADVTTMDAESESNSQRRQEVAKKVFSLAKGLKVGSEPLKVGENEIAVGDKELSLKGIDTENFDNSDPAAIIAVNFEVNASERHQDSSIEAFFPTVEVDPAIAGMKVSVATTYIERPTRRTRTAVKPESVAIINAMYDVEGPLAVNDLRLIPVVNDDGHTVSDFEQTIVHPQTKEEVKTAPVELGVDVDLIAESMTDVMLTEGVPTTETILATLPSVEAIACEITTKDDDDNDVIDYIKFNLAGMNGTTFIAGEGEGEEQGLILNIRGTRAFNLATMTKYDGTETENLNTLPMTYNAELEFQVSGSGNLKTPLLTNVTSIKLVAIRDLAGNIISLDDAAVKDIVDAVATIVPKGVYYDATISDLALAKEGPVLVSKNHTKLLGIEPFSVASVHTSILNGGNINDNLDVNALISLAYSSATVRGIIKIKNTLAEMASYVGGGEPTTPTAFVYPLMAVVDSYYDKVTFSVNDQVDADKSTDKREAFKTSFEDFLGVHFADMTTRTRYNRVAKASGIAYHPVLIVPPALVAAIGSDITVNGMPVKLESNESSVFSKRAVMAIGTSGAPSDPMKAGFRVGSFVKSHVAVAERIDNNKSKITTVSYGKHHVTLPIFLDIELPDIAEYAKKNVRYYQAIA
jgi:hypothetical protein